MAKLVEILARELKEWPEDAECITQDYGGAINGGTVEYPPVLQGNAWGKGAFYLDDPENPALVMSLSQSGDYQSAIVTKDQWQAERDRQKGGEWKRHRGGKQPVANDVMIDVRFKDGRVINGVRADSWEWRKGEADPAITAYRIISQPQAEEVEVKHTDIGTISYKISVDQIAGPLAWRDTIIHCQAIIEDCEREIERNRTRLADEGFSLIQPITDVRASDTDADPTDWRNWKAGDTLECTHSNYASLYIAGRTYKVQEADDNYAVVYDECGGHSTCNIDDSDNDNLTFIRRP
jgi:hypothetical protein